LQKPAILVLPALPPTTTRPVNAQSLVEAGARLLMPEKD